MKTRRTNVNKPSLASSTAANEEQKEIFQPKKPEFKKNVSQVEGKVLFDAPSAQLESAHDLQVPYIPTTANEEAQLLKVNLYSSFGNLSSFLSPSLSNAIQEREDNNQSLSDTSKAEEHEQASQQHPAGSHSDNAPQTQVQPQPESNEDMEELLRLSDEEFQQRKTMLVEHFRTGMQYYTQKWEALVEREQEVVQQTVEYVQHLKKTHRAISHGPYEE